ncbi:MAG: zinc dependent phospholipase C family protein [bacterium]|nr:zinc dependent phospholipase C family protein [bacterium]
MPREFLHWSVLEESILALDLSEKTRSSYEVNWNCAYLGAILHDAPYYLQSGTSKEGSQLGDSLHGTQGENTYQPILNLLNAAVCSDTKDKQEKIGWLAIGMLSHVIVDSIFHPLIYFETGNWYHQDPKERKVAQTAHRLFEVYLDSWQRKEKPEGSRVRFISSLISDEIDQDLTSLLSESLGGSRELWSQSTKEISLTQKRFLNPFLGALLRILNFANRSYFAEFDALFSFLRSKPPKSFDQVWNYKCPVTGEPRKHSLNELREIALRLFRDILGAFLNNHEIDFRLLLEKLQTLKGPTLDTGMVGIVSKIELEYFKNSSS